MMFFIIGFGLGILLYLSIINKPEVKKLKIECKKHDWTYNTEDKLSCCKCGLVADSITFKDSEEY